MPRTLAFTAYPQLSDVFLREEPVDLAGLLADLALGPEDLDRSDLAAFRIEIPTDPDRVRYDGLVLFRVVGRVAPRRRK